MGVSNYGVLVFGIDFGEELPEKWLPGEDEDDDFDFDDMLAKEGGLPDWDEDRPDDYREQKRKLLEASPVSLTWYCTYDYPMYILNIPGYEYSASRGYVEEVLETKMVVPQEKISAMKVWCQDHGVEWSEPKWLLCSMNG